MIAEEAPQPAWGHALVVGGSINGLLAARALADHFRNVTLVERDRFPEDPDIRKGVPQARHPHVLLVRGRLVINRFFPRLTEELLEHGAVWFDYAQDTVLRIGGYRLPRFCSGVATLSCSRALLEWCLVRRVREHNRIRLIDGTRALGLIPDASRVAGVRILGQSEGSTEQVVLTDLVVDASGRGSQAPNWLETLGYLSPRESVVTPYLGYSTRLYRKGSEPSEFKVVAVAPEYPHNPRGAVVMEIEGGQIMATLVGTAKVYPPTDHEGFLDFARKLPDSIVTQTLERSVALTSPHSFRGTENRFRHFESLRRWPERFVVLGDAVCSFNPVYAQGMTVGALGVEILYASLQRKRGRGDLDGLAKPFQRHLARTLRVPWIVATAEDLRWPTTTGGNSGLLDALVYQYMRRLFAVMSESHELTRAFLEVMHMLGPPTLLFHPRTVARVLRRAISGALPRTGPLSSSSSS